MAYYSGPSGLILKLMIWKHSTDCSPCRLWLRRALILSSCFLMVLLSYTAHTHMILSPTESSQSTGCSCCTLIWIILDTVWLQLQILFTVWTPNDVLLAARYAGGVKLDRQVRDTVLHLHLRRRGCRAGQHHRRQVAVRPLILKVNNRSADCTDVSVIPTIVSARCCRRPAAAAAAGRREPRSSVIIHVQHCSLQNNVNIDLLNVCLLGNKHASLCDHIGSNDLHFFVAIETWHESSSCPQVIATTPTGYRRIEKARPRKPSGRKSKSGGGICLFYRSCYTVREVSLPVYTTTKLLAVYVQRSKVCFVVVVLYRPLSSSVANFLFEFADIIEWITAFAVPLFVLGDINLHIDDKNSSPTSRFLQTLEEFDLTQLVNGPTQKAGHTLDVFITGKCFNAQVLISVNPPVISDHLLIRSIITFTDDSVIMQSASVRRNWSSLVYW